MFESSLRESFKSIFEVKKVSFDQPSDSREQECIFIDIESSKNSIKDGRTVSMVTGNAFMFGNADKLPFGFFSKKIKEASQSLTSPFFFFDLELNTKQYKNIIQRSFGFVYFFDSQYDPETGSITSIDLVTTYEGDS